MERNSVLADRTSRRRNPHRRRLRALIVLTVVLAVGAVLAWYAYRNLFRRSTGAAVTAINRWFTEPGAQEALYSAFDAPCPGYPFLVPSSGLVGGLPYNAPYAPYNMLNPHPGIDIFGRGQPGTVPVRAAYDGYLTREENWISAVIIRHDDPLHPGQTIWTYYTHMANRSGAISYILPAFPPGTHEVSVHQGDLLGYQGIYNGGTGAGGIGLHLHFSIVRSDADGHYLNESVFGNTLDPTPYLGLRLNDADGPQFPLSCLPPPG